MTLNVHLHPGTGKFEVSDNGGVVVVTGKIYQLQEPMEMEEEIEGCGEDVGGDEYLRLASKDVYTELRLRGYDYGPAFQVIKSAENTGLSSKIMKYIKTCYVDNKW